MDLNSVGKASKRLATLSIVAVILFASFVAQKALAGELPTAGISSTSVDEQYVRISMLSNTSAIVPGKPFKLGLQLLMQPGWHTYYKESGEAGMPTRISWQLPSGFKASELIWEKPHKFNDAGIVTYGYRDQTLIGATITPPANLKVGSTLAFGAKVKWLSCKDVCVPGKGEASLSLPVAAAAKVLHKDAFGQLGFNEPVSTLKDEVAHVVSSNGIEKHALAMSLDPIGGGTALASPTGEHLSGTLPALAAPLKVLDLDIKVAGSNDEHLNLPAYLALAFIGGFILNFMPCVLPVISIKVLSFMQQAGDHPKRIFQLGLTFTAGIVSAFLVLAAVVVAVQQAGQKVGWGFQFQYPVFLLGMSALVLLFALSLFGLFYVQMAGGTDQIDKLASKEGFTGTFFKGVLATTLSTPCSAPFLGTALGFAFAQPAWVIMLIFLTISLGMAFPYVLLTANPAWMKYIPRPGVWMEKFKESMGFLLLATVVWLMWVLGQQVGINATMSAVGFLVAMSFSVWIVGRFTDLTSNTRRKAIVYTSAGLVLLAGYLTCLQPFPQLLSFHLDQRTAGLTQAAFLSGGADATTSAEAIQWIPFSIDTLDSNLQNGKTVLIDFTADWCLTCKVNENTVLNTPAVVDELNKLKVVTLRADWTRQDADISKLLAKFGRSGVPLYVIFPASRPSQPIVLPEVITQQLVVDGLRQAGASK